LQALGPRPGQTWASEGEAVLGMVRVLFEHLLVAHQLIYREPNSPEIGELISRRDLYCKASRTVRPLGGSRRLGVGRDQGPE
jgi:hypothetical protein